MASGHKPSFSNQSALNIKDHVALNFFIAREYFTILGELKYHSNILDFLFDGIMPKGVTVSSVNGKCLLNRVGKFDAKLVGPLPIAGLDLGDDTISLAQDLPGPPVICWFRVNSVGDCIFGNVHRVGNLEVLEWYP